MKNVYRAYTITYRLEIKRGLVFDNNDMCRESFFDVEIPDDKHTPDIIINFFDGGWISPRQYNYATKNNIPLAYLMWESPLYPNHREPWLSNLSEIYDYIITWDDDVIDNHIFFPHKFGLLENKNYDIQVASENEFNNKKLLCMICSNLSTEAKENRLYRERKKIVKYFEHTHTELFEFYGRGWASNTYKNYKGAPPDKNLIYKNYKFSFCLENYEGRAGYITEKIFDCFLAGIVPIYRGSKNIEDFIPKNTFIFFNDFSNLEELIEYLNNITYSDYSQFQKNINKFLNSEEINIFTKEAFIKNYKSNILRFAKIKKKKKNILHRLKVTLYLVYQIRYKKNRNSIFVAWISKWKPREKRIFLTFLKCLKSATELLMTLLKIDGKFSKLSRISAMCETLSCSIRGQ